MISDTTPTAKLVTITRHQAQQWLANNIPHNRLTSQATIDAYQRDMDAGAWDMNGESIKLDTAGRMFDGQQRMRAFLQSQCKTIRMLVVTGLDPDAVRTVDIGRPRRFADQLRIEESVHNGTVAQVVRRLLLWESGYRVTMRHAPKPSQVEMLDRYRKDPEQFIAAAQRGDDAQRVKLGPGWIPGLLYYLTHQIDPAACHAFFNQLVSGANLPEASPILALRARLFEAPARAEKYTPIDKLYFYVLAWNAWRNDETIELRRYKGLTNANFPTPK